MKKRYNITLDPIIRDKAKAKSEEKGRSLSSIIEEFLRKYIN